MCIKIMYVYILVDVYIHYIIHIHIYIHYIIHMVDVNVAGEECPGSVQKYRMCSLTIECVLSLQEKSALVAYKGNKHKLLFTWCVIALKRNMQRPVEEGGEAGIHICRLIRMCSLTIVREHIL